MTYGHLQADCLYTGISSGPNARYRVSEAFTFLPLQYMLTFWPGSTLIGMASAKSAKRCICIPTVCVLQFMAPIPPETQKSEILPERIPAWLGTPEVKWTASCTCLWNGVPYLK